MDCATCGSSSVYLLDTNVVSEWTRPRPDQGVVRWLHEVDESGVHISVLTIGEIQSGILLLPPGRRRDRLADWLERDLTPRFEGRIVEVDMHISRRWGELISHARNAGIAIGAVDALMAATALVRSLTLVTRDERAMRKLQVPLLNPWKSSTRGA